MYEYKLWYKLFVFSLHFYMLCIFTLVYTIYTWYTRIIERNSLTVYWSIGVFSRYFYLHSIWRYLNICSEGASMYLLNYFFILNIILCRVVCSIWSLWWFMVWFILMTSVLTMSNHKKMVIIIFILLIFIIVTIGPLDGFHQFDGFLKSVVRFAAHAGKGRMQGKWFFISFDLQWLGVIRLHGFAVLPLVEGHLSLVVCVLHRQIVVVVVVKICEGF